jgi:hypothetical protein
MIDIREVTQRLEHNAEAIAALIDDIGNDEARWRPAPGKWSVLEVINHLYDEEREDFRQRIDYVLNRPGEAWPAIDPAGWPEQRDYNGREIDVSLEAFLAERRASIEWLRAHAAADWTISRTHPAGFIISAGDFLLSWLSHDYLHIRQLAKLRYDHAAALMPEFKSTYAGEW